MATNTLNTRIQLKYDSYTAWEAVKATFKPLKGELCIVNPGTQLSDASAVPCLMKVGDGEHFWKDLPWISATAADVYQWAKAANVIFEGEHLKFKAADGTVVKDIDLSAFCTEDDTNALIKTYVGDTANLTTTKKDLIVNAINELDAEIGNLSALNTTNKNNLVAAINEALQAVEVGGTGSVVTVTKQATPTTGSEATYVVSQGGKAVGDKIEIPKFDAHGAAAQALKDAKEYADANDANTWRPLYVNGTQIKKENISSAELHIDNGEVTTAFFDDAGQILTINHNQVGPANGYNGSQSILGGVVNAAGDSLTIKVPVLNVDNYGHTNSVDEVEFVVSIPEAVVDTNTAHTHKVGDGLKQKGNGDITGEVVTELNLAFVDDSDNKLLKLVDATDTTKVIASFDTTKFIADGMLASVTPDVANNKLVFEWNTTAGIAKTEIELDKIADIYTAATGAAEVQVAISNENVVSATLVKVPESKLEEKTQTALGLARTALQLQDISEKADKKVPTAAGNFAALDATGNLADSGKKAADFATKAQGDLANTALQSVKVLGQTLTKNSNEITVAQAKTALGLGDLASADVVSKLERKNFAYDTYVEVTEDGEVMIEGDGHEFLFDNGGTFHAETIAIRNGTIDGADIATVNDIPTGELASKDFVSSIVDDGEAPTSIVEATGAGVNIDSHKVQIGAADLSIRGGKTLHIGNYNSCEMRFGADRALEIDAEEINFVASETDSDPVLKVNGKALSTDHIEAGTEVWIFNCGTASTEYN